MLQGRALVPHAGGVLLSAMLPLTLKHLSAQGGDTRSPGPQSTAGAAPTAPPGRRPTTPWPQGRSRGLSTLVQGEAAAGAEGRSQGPQSPRDRDPDLGPRGRPACLVRGSSRLPVAARGYGSPCPASGALLHIQTTAPRAPADASDRPVSAASRPRPRDPGDLLASFCRRQGPCLSATFPSASRARTGAAAVGPTPHRPTERGEQEPGPGEETLGPGRPTGWRGGRSQTRTVQAGPSKPGPAPGLDPAPPRP